MSGGSLTASHRADASLSQVTTGPPVKFDGAIGGFVLYGPESHAERLDPFSGVVYPGSA